MTGNIVKPMGAVDYAFPPTMSATGKPANDNFVIMYVARGFDLTPYSRMTGEFVVNTSGSYDRPLIEILDNSWVMV